MLAAPTTGSDDAGSPSPRSSWGTGFPVAALFIARRACVPGALWGIGLGTYTAVQALGYTSTYKTAEERTKLAKSLVGQAALVGPGHDLQTAAGYTAWKCLMAASIVSSVWSLLAATRLVRGEEEVGRWELILGGPATRRGAALQALLGLAASAVAMFAAMSCVVGLAGRVSSVRISVPAAAFYSATVASASLLFLAVGILASQLAPTRRRAAGVAGAALGLSFLIRMVADTMSGMAWMRWASPIGWLEEARPLTGSHPAPLALALGLAAGCGWAAVHLGGRRDLGTAVLTDRVSGPGGRHPLDSLFALASRQVRGASLGWLFGTGVLAGVIGSETTIASKALSDSGSARKVLARLGGSQGLGRAYLAVSLELLALMIVLQVINQVTSARSEEANGRLDNLLSQPVSRPRWLLTRAGVALAWSVATSAVAALVIFVATTGQHLGIAPTRYLEAGASLAAPALAVLGLGVLTFGIRPRLTARVLYGYAVWSFLVQLAPAAAPSARWIVDTSVLHQMGAVPARPFDWWSGAVMTAVALAATGLGLFAFCRRDITAV